MIIKSGIIASGSGSLGGLTLFRTISGLGLRARAVPVDPNSSFQAAARIDFGNMSTRWATLTDAQREAWTTYALAVPVTNALGDPVTLSGHMMYIRCNATRVAAGASPVDDGPTVFAQDSLSAVNVGGKVAGLVLQVAFEETDEWVGEDDAGLIVFGSRQQSPTINYFKGPYRQAGLIEGDSVTPPTSPDSTLVSPFALTVGNNTFSRVVSFRADGRISPVQFIGGVPIVA